MEKLRAMREKVISQGRTIQLVTVRIRVLSSTVLFSTHQVIPRLIPCFTEEGKQRQGTSRKAQCRAKYSSFFLEILGFSQLSSFQIFGFMAHSANPDLWPAQLFSHFLPDISGLQVTIKILNYSNI